MEIRLICYSIGMIEKIKNYVKKYKMIQDGDRLIVGVSGGVDSVCLLFVLLELKKEMNIDIIVVHVNHGLRGQNSDDDETFVELLCKEHQLEMVTYHVDIRAMAEKNKQSLEEAGRGARQAAFEKARITHGGTKIVMAHHKNDNAETLLMNLSRGTGLRGIGGMRPVRDNVIRPLLCVERWEIEEYTKKNLIAYRIDESNISDDYTRNRIRNHILPFLQEHVNSHAVQHMNDTMQQMRGVYEYISKQVDKEYEACVKDKDKNKKMLVIDVAYFDQIEEILKGPIILKCLTGVAEHVQNLTQAHVRAVRGLFTNQVGKRIDLPYEVVAIRDYESVTIRKKIEGQNNEVEAIPIQIPGITEIPGTDWDIECKIIDNSEDIVLQRIPQKIYTKCFDYDIIKDALVVRTRRPGDYITIDKNGSKQKIKSYYINEKIPSEMRDQLPLIADRSHVLWIPGYRTNTAYQVTEFTKHVLQIQIFGGEEDGRDN